MSIEGKRGQEMKVIEQGHIILSPLSPDEVYRDIERAGRTAYKSEDKITEGSSEKFIKSIIQRGHESVLEHSNISVRFITDRGVTHEIVRHRLVAYTQESTRYCNYAGKEMEFIKPVFWGEWIREGVYDAIPDPLWDCWVKSMVSAEIAYNYLIDNGATPQEARSVLPNSLKTEIVCTANIREWRHILKLRTAKTAHPQMRALMLPLLRQLKSKLPILFDDIVEEVS